ncbi:MAG: methyl-accepting chemotaxis protein [Stappiaceae bacterium]
MGINPNTWSISIKIPAIILSVGLISAAATAAVSYSGAKHTVEMEAEAKLSAVVDGRTTALKGWLGGIDGDLLTQAQNPTIHKALMAFIDGWQQLGSDQTKVLQDLYITANAHPVGEKEKLDAADDGSAYSMAHAEFHPYLRALLRDRGYYDIFLFDAEGNLVYTVFKELDYATNLITGEWSESDLGKAFVATRDNPQSGSRNFFDFKPYAPSAGAPASFISTPLLNETGEFQGALVFQMPIGKLNALMQQKAGLGTTGETYIVGSDFLMRSDSRFSKETTILITKIETEQVRNALGGKDGLMLSVDYRGVPVVAAYQPLEFLGTNWAVLAEQDAEETFAPITALRNQMIVGIGIGSLLIIAIGVFAGRRFSKPISEMTNVMGRLAEGDLETEIPAQDRKDEIGHMSQAVQVFKDSAIRNKELEASQEEQKHRVEQEKRDTMNQLADDFDASVGGIVETVSAASTELNTTAQTMASIAEETSSQANSVAAASEEASVNVQTVAAATEELSSSIGEINRQVAEASEASKQAVENVSLTAEKMETLTQTADKIGEVVAMISGIAEQTNLLALNATIESARAGEAGKGFAVVASEVKALANETAKATEGISELISEIQTQTKSAVSAISEIGTVINQLEENSTAIAAAMEEQGATTGEVSRNVTEAAAGTQEVSSNIAGVTEASQEAGAAAGQVTTAANELSRQSEMMKAEVTKFIEQVRTA